MQLSVLHSINWSSLIAVILAGCLKDVAETLLETKLILRILQLHETIRKYD